MDKVISISGSLLSGIIDESFQSLPSIGILYGSTIHLSSTIVSDVHEETKVEEVRHYINSYCNYHSLDKLWQCSSRDLQLSSIPLINAVGIVSFRRDGLKAPSFQEINFAMQARKQCAFLRNSPPEDFIVLIVNTPNPTSKSWVAGIDFPCYFVNDSW
jgi:uncharacterized membrane protein